MNRVLDAWVAIRTALDMSGGYLAMLGIRIILAWEFFESGLVKFRGSNWFTQVQTNFPFPFNSIPTEITWALATYTELIGGIAILIGFGTRFFSFCLIILTIVATAAVHWPSEWGTFAELLRGYSISNKGFGNYKLPMLYLVMFLPLVLMGPGKLSVDYLLTRRLKQLTVAGYTPAASHFVRVINSRST